MGAASLAPTQPGADSFVDRRLYTETDVYEREQELIFGRSWLFLCHADELHQPGSFRTVSMADQPVLVVRGKDRQIRAFFNSCRHRGTKVEQTRQGCTSTFRCPYHHWVYDTRGRLEDVPLPEGYNGWLRKEDLGLVPIPQISSFEGLVFGTLDPTAPPLPEYLGQAASYLSESATYNGRPLVVIGSYDYTIDANWKLLAENTMDGYHPDLLHGVAFAQRRSLRGAAGAAERLAGWTVDLGAHGALVWEQDPTLLMYQKERGRSTYTCIFPSLLVLYNAARDAMNIRAIEPLGASRMLVRNYCLGLPEDPPDVTERRVQGFNMSWGPGGRVGIDDIVTLAAVQEGLLARNGAPVVIARGVERGRQGRYEDDQAIRAFWRSWRHYMESSNFGSVSLATT